MEAQQCVQLTGTNRSTGLTISAWIYSCGLMRSEQTGGQKTDDRGQKCFASDICLPFSVICHLNRVLVLEHRKTDGIPLPLYELRGTRKTEDRFFFCPPSSVFCHLNPPFAGLVAIARRHHPIPFRTRPLNSSAPMVLSLKAWESRSPPGLRRADVRRQMTEGRRQILFSYLSSVL